MNAVFETDRLSVRQLEASDLEKFHDLQNNFNVMQYATGKAQTYEENVLDLQHVISCYNQPKNTFWVWGFERKTDAELIGTVAVILTSKKERDIGYRIREQFWGKGYGSEITEGLILHAFNNMGIDKLVGAADVRNTASIKILEKYMDFMDETYNPELDCTDRSYQVVKL